MNELDYKKLAMDKLRYELTNIETSYSRVYEMAVTRSIRDAVFVKELTDIFIQVSAILEVFTRDEYIHPEYALEKIRIIKSQISQHERYWIIRKEEE